MKPNFYKTLILKLPTDYSEDLLRTKINKEIKTKEFAYQIENKSLDARDKKNIFWQIKVVVSSPSIKGDNITKPQSLEIPYKKRDQSITVIGSGPAGFFCAYVLQSAGYDTTIIERGSDVDERNKSIKEFESTSCFTPSANYAFGEGGAGTFSDGKLTSRSKHITKERQYIHQTYINAGAPEEIAYMAHPHLGSDNLIKIVKNSRTKFIGLGGKIHFNTQLTDIQARNSRVFSLSTNSGTISTDKVIIAPGHSAFETYRMLIGRGVKFRTKNFAIGARVEHPQELINLAQWGKPSLAGVKAAEYRLTYNNENSNPVFTFCMCPGGVIVPSTGYEKQNIVNGMSSYNRDNIFANAACVAGLNLNNLLGKEVSALEALDWLEKLEQNFFTYSGSYKAPFCNIKDFINRKNTNIIPSSSYSLGLTAAPLWELLPQQISTSLRQGLIDFNKKLKGFDSGTIMGLESKTSSPIQVLRDSTGLCQGFNNLYLIGEGSGYSGGIISSAADGINTAMALINQN